jgi:hypothetical protein
MGNGASSSYGPVLDVLWDARNNGKSASKAMCLDAVFIGCKQKEDAAFGACDDQAAITPEKKEACDKAAEELRGCLRANLAVIKALAAQARDTHDEEYSPLGSKASSCCSSSACGSSG